MVLAETNGEFLSWSYDSSTSNPLEISLSESLEISAYASGLGRELIENGNFDAGNSGFTTEYYLTPIGDKFTQTSYQVGNVPSTFSNALVDISDHTGNNGNMLIIDASTDTLLPIYTISIDVIAGNAYHFEAWAANIHHNFIDGPDNTVFESGHIGLYINNHFIDSLLLPQDTSWNELKAEWVALSSGNVELKLVSISNALKENDFAIDDISLRADTLISETIRLDPCHGLNIFSPDGDGQFDDYYIDGSGLALIYNTDGTLIKSMELPAYWDGTNDLGEPADAGYYVIVIEKKEARQVTLFR